MYKTELFKDHKRNIKYADDTRMSVDFGKIPENQISYFTSQQLNANNWVDSVNFVNFCVNTD